MDLTPAQRATFKAEFPLEMRRAIWTYYTPQN